MSLMLALHIVFLLLWSAALVYFPQLLVLEANTADNEARHRSVLMQHALYAWMMTPSALLTVMAGIWLIFEKGFSGGWLPVKLGLVLLMVLFHVYCGILMRAFRLRLKEVRREILFYRILPLIPVTLITGVVTLVVAKPF